MSIFAITWQPPALRTSFIKMKVKIRYEVFAFIHSMEHGHVPTRVGGGQETINNDVIGMPMGSIIVDMMERVSKNATLELRP